MKTKSHKCICNIIQCELPEHKEGESGGEYSFLYPDAVRAAMEGAHWPLLRQDAPAIACSLAAEIESNTCPICFELMKSPDCSPMLLYPCGHTFCAKCLEVHTITHKKRSCPYCRQKIFSQALNVSLQKLINNVVALQKNPVQADTFASIEYSEKLRQAETRCKILQCALDNSRATKGILSKDIGETGKILSQLQMREKELKHKLQKVSSEHKAVECKLRDKQNEIACLEKYDEEESAKVLLIEESLLNLEKVVFPLLVYFLL